MIAAFQKDKELLADIERPLPPGAVRIWWLGQSGYLLRYENSRVLLDPYLSDSLTTKYAATDKPHVRMSEQTVSPDALERIDVITSSHNHTDHLDAETILPLLRTNPQMSFVIPEANRRFIAERLGTDPEWPVGLSNGASRTVGGIEFRGVAAAHNNLDRDPAGNHLYLGYVIRCGHWGIYHSGDTLLHEGLAQSIRSAGPIDLAILPINGNKPERCVAGNLDGAEAAALAKEVGAGLVVPCHYDLFEFNTADPASEFVPACTAIAQPFKILRLGESLTLEP